MSLIQTTVIILFLYLFCIKNNFSNISSNQAVVRVLLLNIPVYLARSRSLLVSYILLFLI